MTVIVGAGAAGLSLALMLGDAVLYEKEHTAGGLCRSHCVDGFTFDTGPHILGGIPEAVEWIMESSGVEFVEGTTRNIGWHDGEWLAHPFQNPGLGERYMAKMWKTDPAQLSTGGLGAQAGRKPGGVSTYRYPARGGYQAITDAWATKLRGRIGYGVEIGYGDRMAGACVVTTAPVPYARYNTLVTVTLGFEGVGPPFTAVYLPGLETPFHRLSFPSAFSPHNAPPGCFSVQLEAAVGEHPLTIYKEDARGILEALGITDEPIFDHVEITPHAYPVPDGTKAEGHGRTGGHRYLNLDGVVAASMDLAARLG